MLGTGLVNNEQYPADLYAGGCVLFHWWQMLMKYEEKENNGKLLYQIDTKLCISDKPLSPLLKPHM